MGEVDLHFRPAVPVFDANMALGRRNDRRVLFDSVEDALREMDRAGVARALVYSTVAASDPVGGNRRLEAMLEGEPRLVPQLIGSPSWDDLQLFADGMKAGRASSMRMLPALHGYPLRPWAVGGVVRVGGGGAGAGVAARQLRRRRDGDRSSDTWMSSTRRRSTTRCPTSRT